MKRKLQDTAISRFAAVGTAVILVLIPFHAFLTVWLSSYVGHYTALRLWKEGLLVFIGTASVYLVARTPNLRRQLTGDWLWRLIAAYVAVTVIWGIAAYSSGGTTGRATLYGELLNLRLFAILLIAWVAASFAPWLYRKWQQLVLWPAIGVIAIGILQYFVLPYDFMKHFGYSARTIWPYETIDHKTSYIRIRSTLRGANLLGAYLIVILSQLGDKLSVQRRNWKVVVMAVLGLVVMFASGSRGAWLGMFAAFGVLAWLRLPSRRMKQWLMIVGAGTALIVGGLVVTLRNNDVVQNVVFHTDEHSTSKVSSNSAHVAYSLEAMKQIGTEPLGRGPGTAGPASVYNTGHPARIAENYFLQIGQETGWLGLGLLLAIFGLLVRRLWAWRHTLLAQVLLASFIGLNVMALLMHIWTDDTVAYLWFGLAGIMLAQIPGEANGTTTQTK